MCPPGPGTTPGKGDNRGRLVGRDAYSGPWHLFGSRAREARSGPRGLRRTLSHASARPPRTLAAMATGALRRPRGARLGRVSRASREPEREPRGERARRVDAGCPRTPRSLPRPPSPLHRLLPFPPSQHHGLAVFLVDLPPRGPSPPSRVCGVTALRSRGSASDPPLAPRAAGGLALSFLSQFPHLQDE